MKCPSDFLDAALVFNARGPVGGVFRQIYDSLDGEIWKIFQDDWPILRERYHFSPRVLTYLDSVPRDFDWPGEKEKMAAFGARFISYGMQEYPPSFRAIGNGPVGFYLTGDIPEEKGAIAIVGSRRCTFYGEKLANSFAYELAARSYTIVSGLAIGIDMAAHAGAIRAGGKTVAVLPGGLDYVYPPENRPLYDEIRRVGSLMSECHFGCEVDRASFSVRNRLITALAAATLVIETGISGGTMISARCARLQGKKLMAVPGPIGCGMSDGCHQLIRRGATLVTSVDEILEVLQGENVSQPELELPLEENSSIAPPNLSTEESMIWQILRREGTQSTESLARAMHTDPMTCAQTVQMMIIRGFLSKNSAGEILLRRS